MMVTMLVTMTIMVVIRTDVDGHCDNDAGGDDDDGGYDDDDDDDDAGYAGADNDNGGYGNNCDDGGDGDDCDGNGDGIWYAYDDDGGACYAGGSGCVGNNGTGNDGLCGW